MSSDTTGDVGVVAASVVVAGVVTVVLSSALLLAVITGVADADRRAVARVGAAMSQSLVDTEAALRRFDTEPVDHAALAATLDRQVFGYPAGALDVPPSNQPIIERAAKLLIGLGESRTLSIRAGADPGLAPAEAAAQGQARADAIRDLFVNAGVPESSVVAHGGASDLRHVEFTVLPPH
ncbi:hypothetical protein BH10PSE17_BH10PSE17_12290 [soil metagenome]